MHVLVVDTLEKGTYPDSLVVVSSVEAGGGFFNGSTDVKVLVVGEVPGASEFVKNIHARFPDLPIVGLDVSRPILTDTGCSCFVDRNTVPLTAQALLQRMSSLFVL